MSNDPQKVIAEQLRLLFTALPLSLAGSTINALILIIVLWEEVSHLSLLVWLLVFLLFTTIRGVLLYRYRHSPPDTVVQHKQYSNHFIISSLLMGLVWGGVSISLFPQQSIPHQAFIAFVMAGNSAAAITSLSYLWQAAVAFLIPSLLPLIIQLSMLQTSMSTAMAVMISLFMLISLSGIKRSYLSTRQNITLRLDSVEHEKTILRSQQKLALHVEQTPLAVIEWSTDFRVTDWNPAAEKIFGYYRDEALGKHATELIIPEETKPHVQAIWQNLLNNDGGLHSTNENITKDGQRITCEWYNTPLANKQGEIIAVASLAQDITERVNMEKMQNDFISTVSHELRTPLTSIRGAISLLTGKSIQLDAAESQHLLQIANDNAERLLLIIDDILDIQKLDSGKLKLTIEPVELHTFLRQAVLANQSYADQHNVTLNLLAAEQELTIMADPNRLMQVMYNLLSNAIKFSNEGQTVDICMQAVDDKARISVADHGLGIETEFMDKLFERFSRGDNSNTRQTGGTGLGLNITKKIVEQLGGNITVESSPGHGSQFHVDLPLQ